MMYYSMRLEFATDVVSCFVSLLKLFCTVLCRFLLFVDLLRISSRSHLAILIRLFPMQEDFSRES